MRNIALLSLGAFALASCGSVKTLQPAQPQSVGPQLLGSVEVLISSDAFNPESKVTFNPLSGLSGQALAAANSIEFVRRFQTTVDQSSLRTVSVEFDVLNKAAVAVNNLQFVAYSDQSNAARPSRGGTALNSIFAASGVELTDPIIARAMKPTQSLRRTQLGQVEVDPNAADLQVLSESETTQLQELANTATSGQFPPDDASNANQTTPYLLPYGFVARNLSGGRFINANACTTAPNCNKGLVAFAYQFPLNTISTTPYYYSLRFLVFTEDNTRVTQGQQETESAFTTRAATINAVEGVEEIVKLSGTSTYSLVKGIGTSTTTQDIGKIRTAGRSTSVSATLLP